MNINSSYDKSIFESYLKKIRTEQNSERRRKLVEAVSTWINWLKRKRSISDRTYNSLKMELASIDQYNNSTTANNLSKDFKNRGNIFEFKYVNTFLIFSVIIFNIFFFLTYKSSSKPVYEEQSIGRVLPFKGTINETDGSPLDTKRDAIFSLYAVPSEGTALYVGNCTGERGIEPSFNGSFTILIGSDCGMEPIPESIFKNNNTLYLGIQIGSEPELTPRYQIFTSSFAKDTGKLQGMTPGTTNSSIPYINQEGEIILEHDSPTIKSTNGTLSIQGNSLVFQSTAEDGDIVFDPSLGSNVIIASGKVGIGTFNPTSVLDLSGSSVLGSTVNMNNVSKEDNESISVLRLGLGTLPLGQKSSFVTFYSGVDGTTQGIKVGGIRLQNGGVVYETSGADFAEYFSVSNSDLFEVGQIVAITEDGVVPAIGPQNVIGVVSNSAGFIGNNKDNENSILVGLVGQVEVLASTLQGNINKGDIISTSNLPGFGSKSADVQNRVGYALVRSIDSEFSNDACPVAYRKLKDVAGREIMCGKLLIIIN